jgi:hypothetical protein
MYSYCYLGAKTAKIYSKIRSSFNKLTVHYPRPELGARRNFESDKFGPVMD